MASWQVLHLKVSDSALCISSLGDFHVYLFTTIKLDLKYSAFLTSVSHSNGSSNLEVVMGTPKCVTICPEVKRVLGTPKLPLVSKVSTIVLLTLSLVNSGLITKKKSLRN